MLKKTPQTRPRKYKKSQFTSTARFSRSFLDLNINLSLVTNPASITNMFLPLTSHYLGNWVLIFAGVSLLIDVHVYVYREMYECV